MFVGIDVHKHQHAAEGKTPREARRALKRHLANVLYRQLRTWAGNTPAMNLLT